MIRFLRTNNQVIVEIMHGLSVNSDCFVPEITESFDHQAELLKEHLTRQLANELKKIQEHYYNMGWREAKSKKVAKRKEFWGGFIK